MKTLKPYMDKIEAILAQRKTKGGRKKQTGLLASSAQAQQPMKKTPIELVADYVEGIREAREEMKKGAK